MAEEERVAALIGEWCDSQHRGDARDPEDVIRDHPDLADALREGFSAIELIDLAFTPGAEASGPDRIGDYRVLDKIGSGGMGTVYLAVDESAGGSSLRVALKVLHPHLLERRGFFKRFLREAELGRQVDHENVVRTLDSDAIRVEGETYFVLVTEYVEGRTLRELLDELGVVPEVLVREIGCQVAAGLAAIHEAGIVHRDVKPENVLITDDQRVRIMDLGVARDFATSGNLTRDGEFVGSLAYAAPEQFGDTGAGPSADLYSLGVLLYELATGTNPFHRESIREVIGAHMKETPRPARQLQPDVSLFLSELMRSLLEKDAWLRPESAGSLHATLRESERSAWWAEREESCGADEVPRIPVRRDTELYGREDELAALLAAWRRAEAGEGNVVFLEGEAGIGKSRLIDRFVEELGAQDVTVLYGSYPPAGGNGGLTDAVVGRLGASRLERALGPLLSQTPGLIAPFAALLRNERAPDGGAPLQGDALHAVFCHLLHALEEARPVVWVVDDLHFAPHESRGVVLSLARAAARRRVLLVVASRPGLPEAEVAHFARLEHVRRVPLGRLGAREVIELLRDAFRSEDLAVKLGGRIALKSDGVPFFVFEMMCGLAEGQFITELPDGTWVETRVIDRIDVPSAVRDLIDARLGDLSGGERAILDVGAVQGFEFDPDLVARVLALSKIAVLQDLASIERRLGVIRGGEGVCRFDHHQLQEVLYEDLTPDLRREYHALLGDALAARAGFGERDQVDGELAAQLCDHFLRGGRAAAGLRHLDAALSHLEATYRLEAAVAVARRGLALGQVTDLERAELLVRTSELIDNLGRHDDVREYAAEAVRIAAGVDNDRVHAAALRMLGVGNHKAGNYGDAESALERARELADAAADARLFASAGGNLGFVLIDAGRTEEALGTLKRALARAQDAQLPDLEIRVATNLANALETTGRDEACVALIERQAALVQEVGDLQAQAYRENILGNVLIRRGDPLAAERHYAQSRDLCRRVGDRRGEANAIGNLGTVLFDQGRYDDARVLYERQMTISLELGDRRGETVATGNLATTYKDLGCFDEALLLLDRQLASARELGYRRGEAISLVNRAELLLELGDLEAAASAGAGAAAISTEIGTRWLDGSILAVQAWIADRSDAADAASRYKHALDLLREFQSEPQIARVQIEAGWLALRSEDGETAARLWKEAVELARRLDQPEVLFEGLAALAALPENGPDDALRVAADAGDRFTLPDRCRGWHRIWFATRDDSHLAEAHRLLAELRQGAPERYRDSMVENDPLRLQVARAWSERVAGGR